MSNFVVTAQDVANLEDKLNKEIAALTSAADVDKAKFNFSTSVFELGIGGKRYALFWGGVPVTPEEYLAKAVAVLSAGDIIEEHDAISVELKYLEKKYPEKYRLWLEQTGGASTKFTTGGIVSQINAVRGEGAAELKKDPFYIELQKVSKYPDTQVIELDYFEPITEGNKARVFQQAINAEYEGLEPAWSQRILGVLIHHAGTETLLSGKVEYYPVGINSKDPENPGKIYWRYADPSVTRRVEMTSDSVGYGKVNAGHRFGSESQSVSNKLAILEQLRATTADENVRNALDQQLPLLRKMVKDTQAMDKIFIKPSAYTVGTAKTLLHDWIEQAALLGNDEILIIETVGGGTNIVSKVVKQTFEFSAELFSTELAKPNSMKGATQAGLFFNFNVTMDAIFKSVALARLGKPGSSSMLTELVLKEMADIVGSIFDQKIKDQILRTIKRRKTHVNILADVKLPKKQRLNISHLEKLVKDRRDLLQRELKRVEREIVAINTKKERKRSGANVVKFNKPEHIDYASVVNTINASLRDAVMDRMVRPALINRTGRFAASAKVLAANDKFISFTYNKSPYGVFSQRYGAAPWNSVKARDPQALIRGAIRDVILERFPGVFKERIYIKEN